MYVLWYIDQKCYIFTGKLRAWYVVVVLSTSGSSIDSTPSTQIHSISKY
jgi:hypothetical protein